MAGPGVDGPAEVLWDRHTQEFGATRPCHPTADGQKGALLRKYFAIYRMCISDIPITPVNRP